jgi:hypothetical protein
MQIKEQEQNAGGVMTDETPDISKYGYDKQVSIFAIQENRDFTYTMEIVKSSKNAPNENAGTRKSQMTSALAEWGYTIEIVNTKTQDYEEALEIMTFIFLAREKYSLARQWKTALIKLPQALGDIGMSGADTAQETAGTNQQLGVITQFANPRVLADLMAAAAGGGGGGAGGGGGGAGGGDTTDSQEDVATDDEFRRRLTGLAPGNVSYSRAPERRTYRPGQRQAEFAQNAEQQQDAGGIGRTERIPSGGQGVQRVRVARPQQARPQRKSHGRLDTRPRMNVKETQFKMRKSRINPNLLFTNLTKQNPRPVGQDSIFKARPNNKKPNRMIF